MSDEEALSDYLQRHDLCGIFDGILNSHSGATPTANIMTLLEQTHLEKLGFMHRRTVEGSKIAVNKRVVLVTDLSHCGPKSLEYRIQVLHKCMKLLMTLNARIILAFYDDTFPTEEGAEPVVVSSPPPSSNDLVMKSPLMDTPLKVKAPGENTRLDSLATTHLNPNSGIELLRERLATDRIRLKGLASPMDLNKIDVSSMPPSDVYYLQNFAKHPNDLLTSPMAFLNPLINFVDVYICEQLSHTNRKTLVTSALPRAVGEVCLGMQASNEVNGLGPVLSGASQQKGQRVLVVGDDDTCSQPALTPLQQETPGDTSTASPLSGAAPEKKRASMPLLPELVEAFDNIVNLFDVILVAGNAAWPLQQVKEKRAAGEKGDSSPEAQAYTKLLDLADKFGVQVVTSVDWTITKKTASGKIKGAFLDASAALPNRFEYSDIGPKSVTLFGQYLAEAETVCFMGELASAARDHLVAVKKIGKEAANAAETENDPDSPPFDLSYRTLLASIPPKAHCVVCGESWIDALFYLADGDAPQQPAVMKHRLSAALLGASFSNMVNGQLPAPVKHAITVPYPSLTQLLKGDVFESFAELPRPTARKPQ